MRPEHGIVAEVTRNGQLVLVSASTGRRYRFDATATAMWIAVQQHDGSVEDAACALAGQWAVDPAKTRRGLYSWMENMLRAGLIRMEE